MTKLDPWFERKFTFDFPVSRHPSLLIRLRGTPPRVEELAGESTPEHLTAGDGTWSIQENVGHLLDLEPLWTARIEDFLAGREELTPADLENTRTHRAEHNRRPLDELLEKFRSTRIAWVGRMEGLAGDDFARTARHPRLGTPMRLVDLLYFVAEHDDHHLARIRELQR